jgi:serine/threonine-protein kinase HipA
VKHVIQIRVGKTWVNACELDLRAPDQGYAGACYLQYEVDYAIQYIDARDHRAVSCRFPVNFELHSLAQWPAFALDLLPGGNARRVLLARLDLKDGPTADATLLAHAQHAPGNLRIRPHAEHLYAPHQGFTEADILSRRDTFIEYASEHGASVAGSTGAQGDAPKFLLVQGHDGRWHSEAALPDSEIAQHFIVKFPRGKTERDRLVLRNEAAYMRVAKQLGLHVALPPRFARDTLFVPRFDRRVHANKKQVDYFGMESLCSLTGRSEYGARIPQEELCTALASASADPQTDVLEFIRRDVMNVMLGNTDNHARNSAVLKTLDGKVRLSPLYDFAPMSLDPEGIPRACRWTDAETLGSPDWRAVIALAASTHEEVNEAALLRGAIAFTKKLAALPKLARDCGIEDEVLKLMEPRIRAVMDNLGKLKARA